MTSQLYSENLRMTNINLNSFESILNRVKEVANVKTDMQLAEKLGYSSTGTISEWRKRGEVNWKKIFSVFENANPNYLKNGEGSPFVASDNDSSVYNNEKNLTDRYWEVDPNSQYGKMINDADYTISKDEAKEAFSELDKAVWKVNELFRLAKEYNQNIHEKPSDKVKITLDMHRRMKEELDKIFKG